jgi:hypothetical protein
VTNESDLRSAFESRRENPTSVRDRRGQRAAHARRAELRQLPRRTAKAVGLVVLVGLLLAGGVWAFQHLPGGPGYGHTHSVFRMFVDGSEVSFNHPKFDMSSTRYMDSHLHVSGGGESTSAQYVIHEEGRQGVVTLGGFFESLGLKASTSSVTLDKVQGGQTITNNATHSWQLWVDECADGPDNWNREGQLFKYKHRPHDRMLIVFGPTMASVADFSAEMTRIPTNQELDEQLKEKCPG